MNLEPLKFDAMEVDTSLAKAYLEAHPKFDLTKPILVDSTYSRENIQNLSQHLKTLASLIEKNTDLFCQLEYLNRNYPVKHTRDSDIKLLVNYLKHLVMCPESIDNFIESPIIFMYETSPLVNLGWVAQALYSVDKEPIIKTSMRTAAVCTLFKELCSHAGISVQLEIKENYFSPRIVNDMGNCVGIVTRRSDIESAVDVLLNAPALNIWAVKNIYVEESAIERFKQLISLKTVKNNEEISQFCSDTYHYKNKVYLYEYTRGTDAEFTPTQMYIPIQTYRTVKDLLSVIKPSLCASLWSSDVAESNEIANSLNSHIVWINDYGNFNGSPRTANSYFSHLSIDNNRIKTNVTPAIEKLMKLQCEWMKKDIYLRREIVANYNENSTLNVNLTNDFVDIDKCHMCVGKVLPVEILYDKHDSISLADAIRAIVLGSGVLYYPKGENNGYYDYLSKLNAPVVFLENELVPSHNGDVSVFKTHLCKTKVIWTSYGTIFAN